MITTVDELHDALQGTLIGSITLSVTQNGKAMVSVSQTDGTMPAQFTSTHHWGADLREALNTALSAPRSKGKTDVLDDLL